MTFIKKSFSLFLIIFICSRLGLLLHEFVGHALPAWLLGWEITGYKLTYFYGGWVAYSSFEIRSFLEIVLVQFGGFAVELALAAICFLYNTKTQKEPLKLFFVILGSLALLHSLFYMTRSVYYGYADGRFLFHHISNELRYLSCFSLALLTVAVSYFLSRKYSNYITRCFSGESSFKSLQKFFYHLGAALLIYSICLVSEQAIISSVFREQLFKPHHQHEIEREVAQLKKENKRVSENDLREIKAKHKPFPIDLIFILMLPASVFGYFQRFHFTTLQSADMLKISYYWKYALFLFVIITSIKIIN